MIGPLCAMSEQPGTDRDRDGAGHRDALAARCREVQYKQQARPGDPRFSGVATKHEELVEGLTAVANDPANAGSIDSFDRRKRRDRASMSLPQRGVEMLDRHAYRMNPIASRQTSPAGCPGAGLRGDAAYLCTVAIEDDSPRRQSSCRNTRSLSSLNRRSIVSLKLSLLAASNPRNRALFANAVRRLGQFRPVFSCRCSREHDAGYPPDDTVGHQACDGAAEATHSSERLRLC
jgi:hypothetical protein